MGRPSLSMVLWLALTVGMLAGCAGKGHDGDAVLLGGGQTVELAQTTNSATTGSVSGVVVDDAIRPLGGVNITNPQKAMNTTTSADGLFTFEGLEPGLYTINAGPALVNGLRFNAIQTTADVRAGETTKVRIVLPTDTTPQPYHTTLAFDWYDSAGVVIVDFAIDLFLRGVVPAQCDQCYFPFTTDQPPASMIYESTWEVTVANPAGDGDWYWVVDDLIGGDYADDYCAKPCRVDVPLGAMSNSTSFALTVSADEDWVTYQQRAQLFVTLWYAAPAPDGWSFIAGDK